MGRVYNLVVRFLVLRGIRDTQCGFKCFKRTVASDLFRDSVIDGWSFDVEILSMARLRGYRIIEVPVEWSYGKGSKINPALDTVRMFNEVVTIWRTMRSGGYGKKGQAHNPV